VSEVTVRLMTPADVAEATDVQIGSFVDLDRRFGVTTQQVNDTARARAGTRYAHFLRHDPGGSWVARIDERIVGCGLALRRDDLWGLSLLAVDPTAQSAGIGGRLLDAALGYADGCRRAVIESSPDARAIRAYGMRGFALFPQMSASGTPELAGRAGTARVREADPVDPGFFDEVDRRARGAAHGPDHTLIGQWATRYVVDDSEGKGYAYLRDGQVVYLLAATDEETARALIWRCFEHAHDAGTTVEVHHLAAGRQWAIDACLTARLVLKPDGPVFWRGGTPPPYYIPSGAFL
jgi:GNAT superfamily N-acetyltransferase